MTINIYLFVFVPGNDIDDYTEAKTTWILKNSSFSILGPVELGFSTLWLVVEYVIISVV